MPKFGYHKKVKPKSKPSLGKDILEVLLDFADMLPRPFETPYAHIRRLRRQEMDIPEPKKWQYNQAIRDLQRSKYLELFKKNGKQFVKLTRKGKLTALLDKIEQGINSQVEWDERWRIIVWDIPESSRHQRDRIRYFVKELGFYQVQKSVFITPFQLTRGAVEYLSESGLDKFIRIFRVDQVDNDKYLKKHFGLK